MAIIQTISGPVATEAFGPTLSHEHLCSGFGGMDKTAIFDPDEAVRRAVEALASVYGVGIRTVIDCTPVDLGRQASVFERVAAQTAVQVIAATGVYRSPSLMWGAWDIDTCAEYFLREIQDGIEGSGIKAGVIKIAWDIEYRFGPLGAVLEKCARGAARAAKAGGVPITCHTLAADRHGDRLIEIFEDEGVDLRAVTIGHTNDSWDIDYVIGLARKGATIGLDRFVTRYDRAEMERRSNIALQLAKAGFAEQTSLGHDAAAYSLNGGPARGGPRAENPRVFHLVSEIEVPWLRAHGATEDQIDAMLTRSVRASFEAAAAMKL